MASATARGRQGTAAASSQRGRVVSRRGTARVRGERQRQENARRLKALLHREIIAPGPRNNNGDFSSRTRKAREEMAQKKRLRLIQNMLKAHMRSESANGPRLRSPAPFCLRARPPRQTAATLTPPAALHPFIPTPRSTTGAKYVEGSGAAEGHCKRSRRRPVQAPGRDHPPPAAATAAEERRVLAPHPRAAFSP